MNRTFYQKVFVAAALYNLAFALLMLLKPEFLTQRLELTALERFRGQYGWMWTAVALNIAAMAPLYIWSALHIDRAKWPIMIALMTKVFPPLCWLAAIALGVLPGRALVFPLINDLIWLPALVKFLAALRSRGDSL
jgi:hypothetical protein